MFWLGALPGRASILPDQATSQLAGSSTNCSGPKQPTPGQTAPGLAIVTLDWPIDTASARHRWLEQIEIEQCDALKRLIVGQGLVPMGCPNTAISVGDQHFDVVGPAARRCDYVRDFHLRAADRT